MRVLAAMSGGVDSSVAAAVLRDEGHDVTGVTLKLWGGASDSGCCSISDVEDARRVAAQLDLPHYVFNFAEEFDARVVEPYVASYAAGRTPNPCIECNRSIKWGRLYERAVGMGFDALATGHHARRTTAADGAPELRRGADPAKDQSYVLAVLGRDQLARTVLPVGEMTKADVRAHATRLGLRTAAKAESMDVCFITRGGRTSFLDARVPPAPAGAGGGGGGVVLPRGGGAPSVPGGGGPAGAGRPRRPGRRGGGPPGGGARVPGGAGARPGGRAGSPPLRGRRRCRDRDGD